MLTNLLLVAIGLLLLAVGAEGLIRGAAALAIRFGVSPLVAGLTIVALGTSSPELFLTMRAALSGGASIALGNVIGSNIANIALVLGLAALVRPMPVRARLVRREMPLMIAVTFLLCAMLADGRLVRIEGAILLCGALAYTVFACLDALRGDKRAVSREFEETVPDRPRAVWRSMLLIAAGFAGLVGGANLLLRGAVATAHLMGVSEIVVGLTVVAVGTSLPELATSATAAFRNQADVAFGNAVGSNILNVLGVLGLAGLVRPFDATGLRALDLAVLAASAVAVLPLMARGWILNRWEGGILLAGYATYVWLALT